MTFLLDTQAFLWFVLNDRALSQVACDLIVDCLCIIVIRSIQAHRTTNSSRFADYES